MIESEEMIEEIDEVEESTDTSQSVVEDSTTGEIIEEKIMDISEETDSSVTVEASNEIVVKKKSKVLPLIILFTLLVLDIAAIAIYIIGIDKVLSFIK